MSTKLILFFISSLILTIFAPASFSQLQARSDTTNSTLTIYQYPQDYVQNYTKDCIQTAMKEGLVKEDAQTLCDCTLDRFQQKYSITEFKQLTVASQTDENAASSLMEVGELCFETILFE